MTQRGFNAVMESFFSSVKSETADRFAACGEAKMELFDYLEVFYKQRRRHSTLGQISPAEFERRKNEEGMDPMEHRTERGFAQSPHPSCLSLEAEEPTKNDRVVNPSTESDQAQRRYGEDQRVTFPRAKERRHPPKSQGHLLH